MLSAQSHTAGTLDRDALGNFIKELAKFELDITTPRGLLSSTHNSLAELYRLGDARAITDREREENIRGRWDKLRQHAACLSLSKDTNFSKALQSFHKATKPNLVSEVHFFARVVFYIYRYLIEIEHPHLIQQPDARTRDQAAKAARKLRQLAKKGARLESLQDQSRFETLLANFVVQMDKGPSKRLRTDKTLAGRLFVKRLAMDFLSLFEQPLTTVVASLAMVIGYDADDRNIERVVKEARREFDKQRRNALVDACVPTRQ